MSNLTGEDICNVLKYFKGNTYKANSTDPLIKEAFENCVELIKLDYQYSLINNALGELSGHYPPQLIILENELQNANITNANSRTHTDTIYENNIFDKRVLREHIGKARTARCRTRFVVPVILFRGKQICRSSTVAGQPEIYTRHSYEYFAGSGTNALDDILINEDNHKELADKDVDTEQLKDLPWIDKIYNSDVELLKALNVSTIIDLMVEDRKVKYNLYITSSEKVQTHYNDFTLMSFPYPGCEFFAEYRNQDYKAESCYFNWQQDYVNVPLTVPPELASQLKIDPSKHEEWNLVQLTQNYLKMILRLLNDSTSGILIHCISGWDRTPLFISLLRLSLWADGAIHTQLNPIQILYFTLAYDWMLFGHDLANRLAKGEEILFFCFDVLKYLEDDEFNIYSFSKKLKHVSSTVGPATTNRNDCDLHLETFEDSNGSNISLNSTSSSNSNRDTDSSIPTSNLDTDIEAINGNSPPVQRSSPCNIPQNQRRTSPIAVPNNRRRQRTDSTSSATCGSWQMVTACGSLNDRQSGTNSECGSPPYTKKTVRRNRLVEVRKMFGTFYGGTVGFKMKVGEVSLTQPFAQTLSTVCNALGQLGAVATATLAASTTKQLDDK